MSPRVAIAGALAILLAVVLMKDLGAGPVPAPPPRRPRPPQAARGGAALGPPPDRNVFEYASRPVTDAPAPPTATLGPVTAASPEAATPAPAVRLVGLLRRGGVLKAALSVRGETLMVGPGDAAGDYRVISIDEDGVRLRAPDGTTITLVTAAP